MPTLYSPNECLQRIASFIGSPLLQSERILDAELASESPYIADLVTHTRRFRGKRLRPILLLLFGKATGKLTREHSVLAAVVEMIHLATLVHDDVLDGAEVRRHVATVHTRWNNETSVLYGDYLFTHAFHLAASLESPRACRLIGCATNQICEGELKQIRHRGNVGITQAEYLNVIDGKTGALCAVACRLGALYAEGNSAQVEAAARFGLLLGRAFQIADDVLDLTGAEAVTGKTLGTDLKQRQLTLPLIHLLTTSDSAERVRLAGWLQEPDEQAVRMLVKRLNESGCLAASLEQAKQYVAEAQGLLCSFPPTPARDLVSTLADLSVERSS